MKCVLLTLVPAAIVAQSSFDHSSVEISSIRLKMMVGAFFCFLVIIGSAVGKSVENRTFSESEVKFRDNLVHSSILYGILNATLSQEGNIVSSVCDTELKLLYEGVNAKEVWALKVIDASGSVPEAFIWGSNFWLGSRQECNSLVDPIDLTLTDALITDHLIYAQAPFTFDYRVVFINISTALQIDAKFNVEPLLHLGLCVPQSCSNFEIRNIVDFYTNQPALNAFSTYSIDPIVTGVKKPSITLSFILRPEVIALFVLGGIIVALMLIEGLSRSTRHDCNGNEKQSTVTLFLECFNFRSNLTYIFRTSTPNSISVLGGIRSIVCLWIIGFHIVYYGLHYSESASLFLANSQGFLYQVIWTAVIYVDVFFAISSFLLVYNILGNIELQNEIQGNDFTENFLLFTKYILHRYIRLTPALLAIIFQTEIVNQAMQAYSSFDISENRDFQCTGTWWYNLLYIQNFLDISSMCGGWTWYLACDFQYFIVFLLLLFIFIKSKSLGKLAFITVTAIFIPLSFYSLHVNNFTFRFDAMFASLNQVYFTFWCRMNSYIAGAFMGYLMRKIIKNDIEIKKKYVVTVWTCILILLPGSVTVFYWKSLPVWVCSLIVSGGRITVGIGTGVAIILCHIGHGGWFNALFSYKIFQHTQKLSYTAYLLNPLVIFLLAGAKEKGIQVDLIEQLMFFLAVAAITYVLAVINTLLFERPFQKLSDTFILKRTNKTTKM
ncbi:hypothetical protein DMENIID0001_057670 [Sergentomyia squamirostris]